MSTPSVVYAVMTRLLRPLAEVPADTMALNLASGYSQSPYEPGGGLVDPAGMTTVREFLEAKAALPDARVSER